ncbi:MAG TPA: ABC transporter substrate-binding protein [Rectinemataceae bacterium]|nr:ABC transporter substrate-binding protein [Rectinemataceae bacterium]
MKRKFSGGMIAVIMMAALLPLSVSAQAKGVTLTMVVPNTANTAAYETIFAAFKAKTGNSVEIQALPAGEEYGRLMQTRFATKDYPDLFEMDPGTKQYIKFRADETLYDWTDDPIIGRIAASTVDFQTLDSKIYGIPWGSTGSYGVYYNKAVFKALGKTVPNNWADFIAIAKAAKAAGIIPLYEAVKTGWPLQVFSLAGWTTFVDPVIGDSGVRKLEKNELRLNEIPAFADVLKRQYDLYKAGYAQDNVLSGTYEEQQELFGQGKLAMSTQIPAFMTALEQKFGKQFVIDNVGWFPLPSEKDKGIAMLSPAGQILVPRLTKNYKVAVELVRFMTEKANVDTLYKVLPGIPVFTEATSTLYPPQADVLAFVKAGKAKINVQNRLSSSFTDYPKLLQGMFIDGNVTTVLNMLDENYRKTGKARLVPGF